MEEPKHTYIHTHHTTPHHTITLHCITLIAYIHTYTHAHIHTCVYNTGGLHIFFARVETPCVQRLHRSSCASEQRVTSQVAKAKEPPTKPKTNNQKPPTNPPTQTPATWHVAQEGLRIRHRPLSTAGPRGFVSPHLFDSAPFEPTRSSGVDFNQ